MDLKGFQQAWSKVIVRAWKDASFKARLLDDPVSAFQGYGIEVPPHITIQVKENPDQVISLRCSQRGAPEKYVECTSSCYTRPEQNSQMQIWTMWRAGWSTGVKVSL
jgi:hypothetical protein